MIVVDPLGLPNIRSTRFHPPAPEDFRPYEGLETLAELLGIYFAKDAAVADAELAFRAGIPGGGEYDSAVDAGDAKRASSLLKSAPDRYTAWAVANRDRDIAIGDVVAVLPASRPVLVRALAHKLGLLDGFLAALPEFGDDPQGRKDHAEAELSADILRRAFWDCYGLLKWATNPDPFRQGISPGRDPKSRSAWPVHDLSDAAMENLTRLMGFDPLIWVPRTDSYGRVWA